MANHGVWLSLGVWLGAGLGITGGPLAQAPAVAQGQSLAQTQSPERGSLTAEPGSQINIRTGPGTRFVAQHYGIAGDRVVILESAMEACGAALDCPQWHRLRFEVSGAVGWVRSDFVVRGPVALSETCHRQLAAERSRLAAVNQSFLDTTFLDPSDRSPHRDRPHEMTLMLGGLGQTTVLSSPQFMGQMGNRLIQNCQTVSAVRFASNNSGWQDVYGLINGQVVGFTCVDTDLNRALRWGEYYCGL
ncbi:SH3 domain-containing protein [Leptolyngbya sp. BL0902]|uniref:hypothetical protein n=1 Tax=Leptolyngbya sp. BL0902 TaxID=1115757 RepID=UPI0018E8299C|nr:hypothetical protein [Leptolyngbya sp. BL0902]QQE64646.1 SH3 domain-containing protein [Leptolyngbya sp. BL0902]